jgi:DNA invertase Pin-like site-specific DNA recombinase
MSKVKAIALCRVSTRSQELDGNLEPQKENVEKAAVILDAELVKVWALAVSSRKGKNVKRKDLLEMLEYCKRNRPVKYLIVDEVDRFMRSIEEYYWWKMEFKRIEVRLIHANRPDINPDDDRSVFDELIDVYRAEQSNNERIHKTPEKQKAKLYAGYYPSNPHTGYKKSEVPGLHIPDEPNWSAMRNAFKAMVAGECDIHEGLKRATTDGLRTKNYGPKAVGGRKIDMFRWKVLMCDPYYYGKLKFADWDIGEREGLHKPMITKEEHDILVAIAVNKGKRFIINRNNPEFLLSNQAECARCVLSECKHPRLVGYWQNNGQKKGFKRYRRYRCRTCNLGVRQEALHGEVTDELSYLLLTTEQKEKLKERARKVWSTYEKERIERARIALGSVAMLKDRKSKLVNSLVDNPEYASDIKEELEQIKATIIESEKTAIEAQDFEKDFDEFIGYAFDILDNLKDKWWQLDKATLGVYKQMLFPAGIQLLPDKKVYIPEISLVYTFGTNKKPSEDGDFTRLEGPVRLEPTTPCLKGRCSNRLSYGPLCETNRVVFSSRRTPKYIRHTGCSFPRVSWEINSLHYAYFVLKVNCLGLNGRGVSRLFRVWGVASIGKAGKLVWLMLRRVIVL